MEKKRKENYILAVADIFLMAVLVILLLYMRSTSFQVDRLLSLGAKYIESGDYDSAILTYQRAVAIAPTEKEKDANIGLANAYVGKAGSLPEESTEQILQTYDLAVEVYDVIIYYDEDEIYAYEAARDVSYEQQRIAYMVDDDSYHERGENYGQIAEKYEQKRVTAEVNVSGGESAADSHTGDTAVASNPERGKTEEESQSTDDILVPVEMNQLLEGRQEYYIAYDPDNHAVTLSDGIMPYVYGLVPSDTDRQRLALIMTHFCEEMTLDDPVIAFTEAPAILSGAIKSITVGDTSYAFEVNELKQLTHITEINGHFGDSETQLNYDRDGYLTSIQKTDMYNSSYTFSYKNDHELDEFLFTGDTLGIIRINNTEYDEEGQLRAADGKMTQTEMDHLDCSWEYDRDARLVGIELTEYYWDIDEIYDYVKVTYTADGHLEEYTNWIEFSDVDLEMKDQYHIGYVYSAYGDIEAAGKSGESAANTSNAAVDEWKEAFRNYIIDKGDDIDAFGDSTYTYLSEE